MSDEIELEIAACAARLVVEEGQEYGAAKRNALKALGLPARSRLPSNELVEDEVRDYITLFCADGQPLELAALRAHAALWMRRLHVFRPHLGGAVWRGTATRLSDIYLQLFCDDTKALEILLIDQKVSYQASRITGFKGEEVDALSIHSRCSGLGKRPQDEEIGVHLMVYDYDGLRGALLPDARGQKQRGDLAALERLVASLTPPDVVAGHALLPGPGSNRLD